MGFEPAFLEDWMRDYYFEAKFDIGSSGVQDYALRTVRELAGITSAELDSVIFKDSPCTGDRTLRQAIADRWGAGEPDWVVTTHGASEAIYSALLAVLRPDDHVVVLEPSYHSHSSIPRVLGCEVSAWTLRPESGFAPHVEELAALVSKQRTAAIILNFPHNPTGATVTADQLHRIVEIARTADAYLVWDASLADLTYESAPLPDPVLVYPKTISIGTFSKAFGLPGMRFGWCLAHPDVIARMIPSRDVYVLSLSPLLERIATGVVQNTEKFIGPRLLQAAANRSSLTRWAAGHVEHVDYIPAQGGVTTFPRLRNHSDTRNVCRLLGAADGVLLVPGAAFGHPDRVRLGFGGPVDEFTEALDLLSLRLGG
ncbi:MAG: capreomycidine synthase [Streptomyces sp.]|jgi:capreomycidine synthase|uniref:capreomycidine synthase n=1 Tax=Streptomyces sp. TaxID=1931 RepID=UPI0025D64682|nr:capreomycidine synthase [Streptomyces sp.]MBW8799863.1 capreomycidine synthase [Streptomyces sp.]